MKDRQPPPADATPDLLEGSRLFRFDRAGVDGAGVDVDRRDEGQASDDEDTARVPVITHMPEGIEVVEHSLGSAVGQWVLQVRCQCGRRWFEVEAVEAATCPRCGLLVYVDIQPGGPAA
jgi:hypothetical protein